MTYQIKVNGQDRTVDVDGDIPLLWVLRDVLGMTGTKFACGIGQCGACTVHLDGQPTRSCLTAIDSVGPALRLPPSRPLATHPRAEPFREPGLPWTCRNAAIANRGKSCRPRACSPAMPIRVIAISTAPCPGTSADVRHLSAHPSCDQTSGPITARSAKKEPAHAQ